jgi:hypothetical protein
MAAIFENRKFRRPAINASRAATRVKLSARAPAFVSLAFSVAVALAVPSTQAISHSFDAAELAMASTAAPSPTDTIAAPASERRHSTAAPRPMTSNDRQAIFMVLMLRDPNASSQILGLTH